ncbi:MAG: GTPase Era [Bacilli bacterium]|nr:GTPase Era [Bacilli bacterium]
MFKSGFISIVGRPNVGKSTLLNTIIGKKIAITSSKPQTTRNNIQGIYNDQDSQMIFIDTPGIHKPKYKLGKYLNRQAYYSIDDVDIVIFMVDASETLGGGDKFVIEKLKEINKPVILVLNKVDRLKKDEIIEKINEYKDLYNFDEIIPLSALTNDNVDRLIKVLKTYLKDTIKYFDDNEKVTSSSPEFIISELLREKVIELTDEEVPHSITCLIEHMEEKDNIVEISALIIVDRDSLKKIIIGKKGMKLKEIGTRARTDMEQFLNKKVFLTIYVKTIKKWRDKEKYLAEFGYNKF